VIKVAKHSVAKSSMCYRKFDLAFRIICPRNMLEKAWYLIFFKKKMTSRITVQIQHIFKSFSAFLPSSFWQEVALSPTRSRNNEDIRKFSTYSFRLYVIIELPCMFILTCSFLSVVV
jgi:hypothetical protein